MESQTRKIRIAMLNADIPVPKVLSTRGSYGRIFTNLLSAAAAKISPDIQIETSDYDVKGGQYPTDLTKWDAIVISGSASSAYEKKPWIQALNEFIKMTYTAFPRVKIFGSCFGHQVICQSLLEPFGAKVEKDPKGYEAGVQEITLTDLFRQAFEDGGSAKYGLPKESWLPGPLPKKLRLQFVHGDHVRLPTCWKCLPFKLLGSTQHCAVQGVYQPCRVFTLQGHFEFDRFINTSTLRHFAGKFNWGSEGLQHHLDLADADDDSETVALIIVLFLLEHGEHGRHSSWLIASLDDENHFPLPNSAPLDSPPLYLPLISPKDPAYPKGIPATFICPES
jgi:GMP synthase-like glutamine amidotransferase